MTHYENFKPAQPNILNIFEIVREEERKKFSKKIGNEKVFFLKNSFYII